MRDFTAVLAHLRDMNAEVARLKARLDSIEPPSAPPGAAPRHLHDAIAAAFNRAELRQLAHVIGADTEEFEGGGVTQLALELSLWAHRRGRWRDLLAELTRFRPHVDWQIYE